MLNTLCTELIQLGVLNFLFLEKFSEENVNFRFSKFFFPQKCLKSRLNLPELFFVENGRFLEKINF